MAQPIGRRPSPQPRPSRQLPDGASPAAVERVDRDLVDPARRNAAWLRETDGSPDFKRELASRAEQAQLREAAAASQHRRAILRSGTVRLNAGSAIIATATLCSCALMIAATIALVVLMFAGDPIAAGFLAGSLGSVVLATAAAVGLRSPHLETIKTALQESKRKRGGGGSSREDTDNR